MLLGKCRPITPSCHKNEPSTLELTPQGCKATTCAAGPFDLTGSRAV